MTMVIVRSVRVPDFLIHVFTVRFGFWSGHPCGLGIIDISENGFVRPDLINAYMKTKTPIQCQSISDEPTKKKTKSMVSML